MSFINSLPPAAWTVLVLFLLGVIGTFIYKILTIDWRMMDLEPIRKTANEISKMPDEIKSIGNRVGTLEKTTATLEKTTEHVGYRIDNLEKTTEHVVDRVGNLEKTTVALEKMTEHVVDRVATLEKTTEHVVNRVGNLEKTTEIVLHRVGNLERTTASVSKQIAGLSGQQYTEASSPMSLNTRGKELSKEMDAAEIASRYKEKLVDKAKSENGGPYQIQESCLDCAADEILKDLEEKDKKTYRHLTDIAYSEGVQVEVLMRIVGLVLRDQVLQAINQPPKDTAEKTAE